MTNMMGCTVEKMSNVGIRMYFRRLRRAMASASDTAHPARDPTPPVGGAATTRSIVLIAPALAAPPLAPPLPRRRGR
jgi:hypothetical protein